MSKNHSTVTDPGNEESAMDPATPNVSENEQKYALGGFQLIERLLLILVAIMTLGAVAIELKTIYEQGSINLADILLMFLYTEVIAMTAVFYTSSRLVFIYPIFIAITALSRLIVLQGKDMAPQNILYEAGAILLLAIAAFVVTRIHSRMD
jgi:protein PsiE